MALRVPCKIHGLVEAAGAFALHGVPQVGQVDFSALLFLMLLLLLLLGHCVFELHDVLCMLVCWLDANFLLSKRL